MKKILLLILVVFLSGCASTQVHPSLPPVECTSDSDCAVGGCSGQLCGPKDEVKDIATTCEWREVYDCYKLTSCSCVDNGCIWEENDEFKSCMEEFK